MSTDSTHGPSEKPEYTQTNYCFDDSKDRWKGGKAGETVALRINCCLVRCRFYNWTMTLLFNPCQ